MDSSIIGIVLALLGAFGGLSGIAALRQAGTAARKSEVEQLQIALDWLSGENVRLRARLDEMEQDLDATQSLLDATRVQLDATRKMLEENQVQLGKYEAEVRRLRARVSELERENRRLREQTEAEGEAVPRPYEQGDGQGVEDHMDSRVRGNDVLEEAAE